MIRRIPEKKQKNETNAHTSALHWSLHNVNENETKCRNLSTQKECNIVREMFDYICVGEIGGQLARVVQRANILFVDDSTPITHTQHQPRQCEKPP